MIGNRNRDISTRDLPSLLDVKVFLSMFHEHIRSLAVTNSKDLIGFPSGRSSVEGGSLKFRKSGSEVRGEKRKVPSPFVVQSAQDNSEIRRFSIPQRRTRGPLLSNESFKGYKNNGRNNSFSSYPGVKINFLPTRRPIRSKSCPKSIHRWRRRLYVGSARFEIIDRAIYRLLHCGQTTKFDIGRRKEGRKFLL